MAAKSRKVKYIPVTGRTGYFIMDQSLVVSYDISETETVLIDSGYTKNDALIDMLKERGKTVPAVLCTHLHVDHMGNNGLLQRTFGAKIYVAQGEVRENQKRFESQKDLPFSWMDREKYFFGDSGIFEPSIITPEQKSLMIGNAEFTVERLEGHSHEHLGFATPDGILHIGDALMSDNVLRHSKVPYELNVTKALETLEKIRTLDYSYFAASHRAVIPKEKIDATVQANIDYHLQMTDEIEHRLNGWQRRDKFILEAIGNRGVKMSRTRSSGWLPAAIQSYIDHLIRQKRILCSTHPSSSGIIDGEKALESKSDAVFLKRSI